MSDDKKTIPSTSIEAQEILRRMLETEIGDVIPYEELDGLAMGNIRNGKYWALNTARRAALRDHNMVFQTVKGIGIKRANDAEIVDEAGQGLNRVHRRIGRDLKKLAAIGDYKKLPAQIQIQYNARMSQLGALYLITKTSTAKRLEGKVADANQRLSLPDTLEFFKKG